MRRFALILSLGLLLLSGLAEAKAPGQNKAASRQGKYEGGYYRINIPANWNGGLVLFAHGYEGESAGLGSLRYNPLRAYLARHGYASAAAGYRSRGYRPDWFVDDMLALRALFIRQFGKPRWTVIHGQSMGGHISVASMELHPGTYQGALIECGVVTGVGEADFLYAYTAAAEFISGIKLLDAPDRKTFQRMVSEQWLPVMGRPGDLTRKGRQFESVVKHLMGGGLPLWRPHLRKRYLMNLKFRGDSESEKRPIHRAASTMHIKYRIDDGLGLSAEELNKGVRRLAPLKGARSPDTAPVFAEVTGRIAAPIMTLHNTGDAWVPFSLQQDYRRKTMAAGTSHLLVQRAVRWPGHCNFIDASERERAFEDLVKWIETGARPKGDDVLAADPSAIGLPWTAMLHPADPASN